MDFRQCAKEQNILYLLEEEIKAHAKTNANNPDYCANEHWYEEGGYRQRLENLVGWRSGIPILQTSEAYDACYEYLYDLLPDCNHHGTCRG